MASAGNTAGERPSGSSLSTAAPSERSTAAPSSAAWAQQRFAQTRLTSAGIEGVGPRAVSPEAVEQRGLLPERRMPGSPSSSTPRSSCRGFVENPFEIGSEAFYPRARKAAAPSAATIDELEELETADVVAATQRILQDLVVNPFELIPGASDVATPAWNPQALKALGAAASNNSPMVLDFLHQESERNLGRLMNNVSSMRGPSCSSSPSGKLREDASTVRLASEEQHSPEGRPPAAAAGAHERAPRSSAITPRGCYGTPGQVHCEFTPPSATGQQRGAAPLDATSPSAASAWAALARSRSSACQLKVGAHSLAGKKMHCQMGWANQDVAMMLQLGSSRWLVGVFDGHGEHGHEMASAARELFSRHARELLGDDGNPGKLGSHFGVPDALRRIFLLTQDALERGGRADWSGTTATVAFIDADNSSMTCAHVGDSRLLVANRRKVLFETADHNVDTLAESRINASGGEVRRMTVSGVTASRIFIRGQGLPGLSMSRSLGDGKAHSVGVLAEPSIEASVEFAPGSTLIIASDGVWEKVSSGEAAVVSSESGADPEAAAINLAVEARSRWLQTGGDVDDITAVVVHTAAPDPPRANGKLAHLQRHQS